MDFDRDSLIDANPKEEIVELITQELGKLRRRLSEIKDQIESMQTSVDREQSRYSGIATELRNIKENIDTVPREDIRDKYDEALDVRFRLATMRGQLEKFEGNYDFMEHQQSLLSQILSKLQGFEMLPDNAGETQADSTGALDVIGIIQAQEDERRRLARAMHDGPAQSLTNFILQTEIVQRFFDRDPSRAAGELKNLKEDASKTFQKVRDFIFDLRPMMLDDLGVAPTVRRYVESFKDKNEIEVRLEILGTERRLEGYVEVMSFRSIQELMVVARDYASSTEIEIKLDMSLGKIKIVVEDNGRGFNTEHLFKRTEDEAYADARAEALNMLKKKVELVGGSIDVTSEENEGTVVRVELPTGE